MLFVMRKMFSKLIKLILKFAEKEEPHPSSKLKLWMGPENLGASHVR